MLPSSTIQCKRIFHFYVELGLGLGLYVTGQLQGPIEIQPILSRFTGENSQVYYILQVVDARAGFFVTYVQLHEII